MTTTQSKAVVPAVKEIGVCISAALEPADRSAWPDHRSASIAVGHVLMITIRDAHTGEPVQDAWVRGVDVCSSEPNDPPPAFELGDSPFDLPPYDTPYETPFSAKNAKELDDKIKKIKDLEEESITLLIEHDQVAFAIALTPPAPPPLRTAPELSDRLEEIEKRQAAISRELDGLVKATTALMLKRKRREDWVLAIKALLAVHGRWDDPIDGSEPDGWATKAGTAFRKITGNSLWSNSKAAIGRLWDKVGRSFKTDKHGVVSIPLPAETSGFVRVEMRHIKLLHPDDAILFDPSVSPACRVRWDQANKAGDDPREDPRPVLSGWTLEQELNGHVSAPFRNHLVFEFDTVGRGCQEPFRAETLALVWCQCAWTPTDEKDYVREPGDTPNIDGRGLHEGHPTFFIPTRPTGSGRRYGEFGNARTIVLDTTAIAAQVDAHIVQSGGVWHHWVHTWTAIGEFTSKSDADEVLAGESEPHKTGLNVLTAAAAKAEKDGLKLEDDTTHVLVRKRHYTAHPGKEQAEAAALNRLYVDSLSQEDRAKNRASRELTRVDIPGKTGDEGVSWRVSYKTTRAGQAVSYESTIVDTPKKAIDLLFKHRIHYGVDIAGGIDDPIFAPIGGISKAGGNANDSGGGLKVGVTPWIRNETSYVSMCHNKENTVGDGQLVKAGDILAIMGRTGNHRPRQNSKGEWRGGDRGAPTHTHFSAYMNGRLVDFRQNTVRKHWMLFPRNNMPHLLPCAGEYEDDARFPLPKADDPRTCKVRGGPGPFDPAAPRMSWLCWAFKDGTCPYKP